MKYLSVKEVALIWNTSERSVRNYCNAGRVLTIKNPRVKLTMLHLK